MEKSNCYRANRPVKRAVVLGNSDRLNLFEDNKQEKTKRLLKAASSLVHGKFLKACSADRVEEVELLLGSHLIDIDVVGNDHKTALYHAITAHSLPLVRLLVKHGADVSRKSFVFNRLDCSLINFESCDEPPVVTAAREGTNDILRCLLHAGANSNDQSEIPYGHTSARGRGGSALHFASEAADVRAVTMLLNYHADVDIEDAKGERPLHLAVRCKPAVCTAQREIVKLLCAHGANVEALTRKEYSPLFLAALYGCTAKTEALIRHGASVNATGDSGYGSALHVAAYKDRLALAALLVCAGARLDRVNAAGYTPLTRNVTAHARSQIATLLIYHGARMDVRHASTGLTILAMCINSMRLDCESLAVLIVQAGYNLSADVWLVPEHLRDDFPLVTDSAAIMDVPTVAIPAGRVRRLCDWLRYNQSNPRSLAVICRTAIRRRLSDCNGGTSIVAGVGSLPLPAVLRNFVLLKDATGNDMEKAMLEYLISFE